MKAFVLFKIYSLVMKYLSHKHLFVFWNWKFCAYTQLVRDFGSEYIFYLKC